MDTESAGDTGRRRPASAQVGDRLAGMIFAGELGGGQRLPPERELVQRFGVSRSVVREAITSLAQRGLLLARPGHRPIVRSPSFEVAIESLGGVVGHLLRDADGAAALFGSRVFFEAALARHAALHASAADLEGLAAALERNRAAIGDPGESYLTDVAFHGALYRVPRNPIFPAVHKAYVDWLMRHWARMHRGAELDRLNHAGHAAILGAIAARDPDAAEAAMRRHLGAAWEQVSATFAGTAPPGTRDTAVAVS
jgi:GntR family transcriptional regulator, sialic acid-inducible nan operon repressor